MKSTRGEIFQAVWTTPVTRLAKAHGVSDVGFAKACRAYDIPLPPRGYWARLAAGQKIAKPKLNGDPNTVVEVIGQPALRRKSLPPEEKKLIDAVTVDAQKQPSAELLRWTRKARAALSRKSDADGFVRSHQADAFWVLVSEASRDRAIGILNTLEVALPKVGLALEPSEKHGRVVATMHDEVVVFEIRERYTRQEHIKRHPKYEWMNEKTYTYTFLGELVLKIDGYYDGRKSWSCGKTSRLEDKLTEVVEGFVGAAEGLRKRTLEFAERERRWAEQRQRAEEHERLIREQRAFLKSTIKEASAWRNAKLIRRYAVHLRAQTASNAPNEEGRQWLARIENLAAHMDPTTKRLSALTGGPKLELARLLGDDGDADDWGDNLA